MDNIELKVFELTMTTNSLKLGMRVRGSYNPKVQNPIATLIFTNGSEERRLPIPIQTYYPEEDLENYYFFATYSYNMKKIFWSDDKPHKTLLKVEVRYGDKVFTDIEFNSSKDLIIVPSETYEAHILPDKPFIEIVRIAEDKEPNFLIKLLIFSQYIIRFIWKIVLFALAILLLPIFFVEALLSMIGCAVNNPDKKFKGIMKIAAHIRWRLSFIITKRMGFRDLRIRLARLGFAIFRHFKVKSNRVTFLSNRRDTISGNYEYIYEELSKNKSLDIRKVLTNEEGYITCFKFGYYLATSKVILVDDYIYSIYEVPRRSDNYLIQVWHACGAFKTFGFSRIGKSGGPTQTSKAHRNYDYCTVSSKEICKFYAEGFGLSPEKVKATGVPRTDIFFREDYKNKTRKNFYKKYPALKDKKIILFAPTFRGNGKVTGSYPEDRFDFIRLYEYFKGKYAIIIKHHPFVNNRVEIPLEYTGKILDMSDDEELNDLLFVTDLLITDYSSVVFEASLLNIPMLFYAFDLQKYISSRGFYYEYRSFVPGKIVSSMKSLIRAIKEQNFEIEKIKPFREKFFDKLDGKAGYRVAKLIENLVENKEV